MLGGKGCGHLTAFKTGYLLTKITWLNSKVTSLLFDVNYKFNNGNFALIITYIYIISYMLPWVLRPKKYYHLEIYSLSFKGSTVFLAFPHNSFWPVTSYETVILTCKKCTGIRQTKSSPQWAIIMLESKKYC